ncbi:MAG: hypothetical protein Q8M64_08105 [Methyloversatilis sp.]|nr:hypothetical protein [Methyloversatilis sp.]
MIPSSLHNIVLYENKGHAFATLADSHAQRVLDRSALRGLRRASDLDATQAPCVVLTRLTRRLQPSQRRTMSLPLARGARIEARRTVGHRHESAASRVLPADRATIPRIDHPTAAPDLNRDVAHAASLQALWQAFLSKSEFAFEPLAHHCRSAMASLGGGVDCRRQPLTKEWR